MIGLLLAVGAGFGWLGLLGLGARIERRLTPALTPGPASGRRVTFTGTTNAAEPMLSPVSRRACVWWSWSLQERYRGSASSEPRWHERAGATSGSWFDLTDAGMRVQVDPRGATVTATNTTLAAHELGGLTVRQLAQASQGEVRFVRRDELPARQPIAQLDGDWRLLETIIGPGEDVWACGTAGQVPPPDDGTLLRTAPRFPLLLSTRGEVRGLGPLRELTALGLGLGGAAWTGGAVLAGGWFRDDATRRPGLVAALALVALAAVIGAGITAVRRSRGGSPSPQSPSPPGPGSIGV